MEVMARTGAQVINNQVEKNYLRKNNPTHHNKPDTISFGNILKLQD